MGTTYKPCKYAPDGQHRFGGEDGRCFDCDAKPWYVSIRYACDNCFDKGFTSTDPDSVTACSVETCEAGRLFRAGDMAGLLAFMDKPVDPADSFASMLAYSIVSAAEQAIIETDPELDRYRAYR
jgi:hypothetical protein